MLAKPAEYVPYQAFWGGVLILARTYNTTAAISY